MKSVVSTLTSILGADGVFSCENLPNSWSQRLSGVFEDPNCCPCLALPKTIAELAEVVVCASQSNWCVIPAGRGLQLSWGKPIPGRVSQHRSPLIVSTDRLDRVIDHAVGDLTFTAEAGLSVQRIQEQLSPHDQFLALQGLGGLDTSLGGLLATANAGSWRHRYGGVRDQVLGIQFVRADGQVAKAGGRVVKNVAGYDLMKLFTGSYGSLGILTQATVRLYPLPDRWETIVLRGDREAISTVTQTVAASPLTPVAMDVLSAGLVRALGAILGMDNRVSPASLGLTLQFASLDAAVKAQVEQVQTWAKEANLRVDILSGDEQTHFWKHLQIRGAQGRSVLPLSDSPISPASAEDPNPRDRILCKIGVLPSHALETLDFLEQSKTIVEGMQSQGLIHCGSGLGWVELAPGTLRFPVIQNLRQYCQERGGFLTVLEGSIGLKQQLDPWGYRGNALPLMAKVKQAFDPHQLFNPDRFTV